VKEATGTEKAIVTGAGKKKRQKQRSGWIELLGNV
jgi:hypothetical protein